MPSLRTFPPPWMIDENPDLFIVRDATGRTLAYFYFHGGNRFTVTEQLSKEEAFGVAVNFTKLPQFLELHW